MSKQDDGSEYSQAPKPTTVPHLTGNAPKIGGLVKQEIEDFEVDEIPAYEPSGEGPHIYLRVEKRNVDGRSMIEEVSGYFDIRVADIGTAGTKDRRAVTRQWISVPADGVDKMPAEETEIADGITVLKVSRHKNKLRTGHLRGNRFRVVIRDTELKGPQCEEAVGRIAGRIQDEGLPNFYGTQRFGDSGSTLKAGWKWVREGRAPKGRFLRRMAASALQSEVFNRVLARRLGEDTWRTVIDGDIFEKVDTGGRFWIQPPEREETQRRLDAKEISVTGPMPGSRDGLASGTTGELEREILAELEIDEDDLKVFGRGGRGTRRPLTIFIDDLSWEVESDSVNLEFTLPSGTYATVLLREFTG